MGKVEDAAISLPGASYRDRSVIHTLILLYPFLFHYDIIAAMEITVTGDRIAARLKRLRRERSWSQRTLSAKSGLTQPTISWIEMGKGVPRLDTIAKLAAAFGVSPMDLAPRELLGDIETNYGATQNGESA